MRALWSSSNRPRSSSKEALKLQTFLKRYSKESSIFLSPSTTTSRSHPKLRLELLKMLLVKNLLAWLHNSTLRNSMISTEPLITLRLKLSVNQLLLLSPAKSTSILPSRSTTKRRLSLSLRRNSTLKPPKDTKRNTPSWIDCEKILCCNAIFTIHLNIINLFQNTWIQWIFYEVLSRIY